MHVIWLCKYVFVCLCIHLHAFLCLMQACRCSDFVRIHCFSCPVCVFLSVYFQGFVVEVQLDSMKQDQKESIRRTLFLDSQQPSLLKTFSLANGERLCYDTEIYLRVSPIRCFSTSLSGRLEVHFSSFRRISIRSIDRNKY